MPDQKGPCPVCGRWENRATVVDAVAMRDGQVLLIRRGRDPEKGKYALPGGYVDRDETAAEACLRELREETGLAGRVVAFLGYYDGPARDPARQNIALAFLVESVAGEAVAGDDAEAAGWFPLEALPPLAFDHGRILDDARALAATPTDRSSP